MVLFRFRKRMNEQGKKKEVGERVGEKKMEGRKEEKTWTIGEWTYRKADTGNLAKTGRLPVLQNEKAGVDFTHRQAAIAKLCR